jgi:hypothetical protein
MKKLTFHAIIVAAGLGAVPGAHAYEFRIRWTMQTLIWPPGIPIIDGVPTLSLSGDGAAPLRLRMQFGVFDDAAGPALLAASPAGPMDR